MADASDTKDTFELDGQVEGVKSPSNNSEQSQVDDGYLRSSTEEGFKPLKDDGKVRQSQEFSMAEIQVNLQKFAGTILCIFTEVTVATWRVAQDHKRRITATRLGGITFVARIVIH